MIVIIIASILALRKIYNMYDPSIGNMFALFMLTALLLGVL